MSTNGALNKVEQSLEGGKATLAKIRLLVRRGLGDKSLKWRAEREKAVTGKELSKGKAMQN